MKKGAKQDTGTGISRGHYSLRGNGYGKTKASRQLPIYKRIKISPPVSKIEGCVSTSPGLKIPSRSPHYLLQKNRTGAERA